MTIKIMTRLFARASTCRNGHISQLNLLMLLVTIIVTIISSEQAQAYDWPWSISDRSQLEQQQQEFSQQNVEILQAQASLYNQANRWRVMDSHQGDSQRYDCTEPSSELFEEFVRQYRRNELSNGTRDRFDRLVIFTNTVRRAILFNKVVAADLYNISQAQVRTEMGNYYYIKPRVGRNWALWYADIDDCELGLMKSIVFNIIHMIDDNNLSGAYAKALNESQYLPLLSSHGFQQMAEILLIRLFDRFQGDSDMNKLFKWPLYAKKLASYAYNRQQASQANFKSKLALISFAYPAYFKDIKYNTPAVNRTQDNLIINEDFEYFNRLQNRKFANTKELNRRRVVFRQRITHVRLLSEEISPLNGASINNIDADGQSQRSSNDFLFDNNPQMARFRRLNEVRLPSKLANGYVPPREGYNNEGQRRHSANLQADSPDPRLSPIPLPSGKEQWRSQFSDLTDEEFVAYLTQDFDQLDSDQVRFLEENFRIEPLNQEFRDEIAYELLFRRTIQEHMVANGNHHNQINSKQDLIARLGPFSLARQVVDELISDIGLPMGPAVAKNFSEADVRDMFLRMGKINNKMYANGAIIRQQQGQSNQLYIQNQPAYLPQPNEGDLADERLNRYEQFRSNFGRFKAWWLKEQWLSGSGSDLVDNGDNGDKQATLLRFADMSWLEIKLILFKLCCLNADELTDLARHNITLHYLASNNQYLCQPIASMDLDQGQAIISERLTLNEMNPNSNINVIQMQKPDERLASELYYYYRVHFNKHHLDADSFSEAFTIFRANIEQLKRHSCLRSQTLYKALRLKRVDMMNTMDTMDPRRNYMDDINLDRFKYFSIPPLQQANNGHNNGVDFVSVERLKNNNNNNNNNRRTSATSTNDFYRHFAQDQNSMLNSMQEALTKPLYAVQFAEEQKNHILFARNYQQHKANGIYNLVKDRYKLCVNMVTGIELGDLDLSRMRCETRGKLADKAIQPIDWPARLTTSNNFPANSAIPRNAASCNYYYSGLDVWAQNLIKQNPEIAISIESARC